MEQVGIALAPRTGGMCEAVETMFEGKLRAVFTGDPTGYHPQNRLTLYWGELEWVTFFTVTVKGESYIVAVPTYGESELWEEKGDAYIYRYGQHIEPHTQTIRYLVGLNNNVYLFAHWYLKNIAEVPRKKYILRRNENKTFTVIPTNPHQNDPRGMVGGEVDGPGVLPHWGRSWVFGGSIVKGVRLSGHTRVRGSSKVQFAGANPPAKAVLVRADTITGSRISLQQRSIIETGCLLEWVHLDGVIRIKANSTLAGVTIRSRDKLTSLRMNTFLHNVNLAAGRGAALPFVQVAPIGADDDLLTVWYDSKEKQILAKRGCFKGTIEEFLRSAQARYGDSSTPGGTHIFYTYQNLLPTLVAQVRSLMPEGEK